MALSAVCAFAIAAQNTSLKSSCSVSVTAPPADSRNLFTLAQEQDLGDALAESQLLDLRVLAEADPRLQQIAERLVRNTPLAALQIRTFLIEMPEANAFVLPGGRVYVSRPLLALVQNEDELAGVLAHELGHLAAHQQAIAISRLLNATMGVTSLGDRRDVFDKYSQLLENQWRKRSLAVSLADKEEKDQIEADRLGLAMQAAAGYDPGAQVRALDRVLQTNGKTGSFLSNLFNSAPNQKRLGELMKNLPPECAATHPAPTPEFLAWRKQILDLNAPQLKEALPASKARVTLQLAIRNDLEQVHFSPDGRFVLALDDLGITVLSVEPFKTLFRISVENVADANFTPDSSEIAFVSAATHVERWNVPSQSRTSATDLVIPEACVHELLAPDGKVLACHQRSGVLRLLDVGSGVVMAEKKEYGVSEKISALSDLYVLFGGDSNAAEFAFSPDSRYFLAFPMRGAFSEPWAVDLKDNAEFKLQGDLKKVEHPRFVFLDANRLLVSPVGLGAAPGANVKAAIYSFPDGKALATPTIPYGPLFRATDPNYVIIRPYGKVAALAMNYTNGSGLSSRVPAIDTRNEFHVAERTNGELALYRNVKDVVAVERLPQAELRAVHSFAVSPDLHWLALSLLSRSALWNLQTGEALSQATRFDGSYFDGNGRLILDFSAFGDVPRHTMEIHLAQRNATRGADISARQARQHGRYIVEIQREEKTASGGLTLYVKDAITLKEAWSKKFSGEAPTVFFNRYGENGVYLWSATSQRVENDAAFKADAKDAKRDVGAEACSFAELLRPDSLFGGFSATSYHVAESVSLATGDLIGQPVVVDMVDRCIGIKQALPLNGSIVVGDSRGRVLLFTGNSGAARLRFFGHLLDADAVRNRILVRKEAGRAVVYDAQSGAVVEDFHFASPIAAASFADGGKLLLAITGAQEAITLPVR